MLEKLIIYKKVLAASFVSILLFACHSPAVDSNSESKSEAPLNKLPVDVIVAKYDSTHQELVLSGSVKANRSVEIVSEIPKKITEVLFNDGQFVSKDQLLYKIENDDLLARLKEIEANLNILRLTEQRLANLLKVDAIKVQEYDEAAAKLNVAEAGKDFILNELKKTEIRAPFSGKVGISTVFPGSFVSPGTPLVSLHDNSVTKIEFYAPEKYIPFIKTGNSVQFLAEGTQGLVQAKINAVEPYLNATSRSIKVQAIVQKEMELMGGMSAKIYLNTSTGLKKIFLPTEALIAGESGYSVFVVKDGLAKIRPVSVGTRSENKAMIASGLLEGDTIIISNILRTSPDAPVLTHLSN